MLNKRGQNLSITTIVVIILALLVLVVMAIIFTGGTATLQDTLRNIFGGSTAGTDIELAKSQCDNLCQLANPGNNPGNTGYCKATFNIKQSDGSVLKSQTCMQIGVLCDKISSC